MFTTAHSLSISSIKAIPEIEHRIFAKSKVLWKNKILSATDKQLQTQAKICGILYGDGAKPGSYYSDLEPDNEFWNRVPGFGYTSE